VKKKKSNDWLGLQMRVKEKAVGRWVGKKVRRGKVPKDEKKGSARLDPKEKR